MSFRSTSPDEIEGMSYVAGREVVANEIALRNKIITNKLVSNRVQDKDSQAKAIHDFWEEYKTEHKSNPKLTREEYINLQIAERERSLKNAADIADRNNPNNGLFAPSVKKPAEYGETVGVANKILDRIGKIFQMRDRK